jgi:hypothetical protein
VRRGGKVVKFTSSTSGILKDLFQKATPERRTEIHARPELLLTLRKLKRTKTLAATAIDADLGSSRPGSFRVDARSPKRALRL